MGMAMGMAAMMSAANGGGHRSRPTIGHLLLEFRGSAAISCLMHLCMQKCTLGVSKI